MFFLCFLSIPPNMLFAEVGKLSQVQNGTPPTTNYNGVDAVHACNILQQLKALYDEAQLTDIVVEVDHGKTYSCHRNVLAAISPYFRSMFTSGLTESSQREVRIVGVESESMHLVLDYAYTSRVTLSESNVQALFTAASIFQIPALQDQCAQFMISRLDPQNCIGVYMFADAYGHQELRERSQDYIRKKFICVSWEQEFLQMTKEQLVSILNSDDLNVDKEEHVYESIVRWHEHDRRGREAHLPEVFSQCIRLPLLDEAFLSRIPAPFACALSLSKDPAEAKARLTGTNGCPQRLGMTASEMVICFDAAHKHSGKKQTVPCLDTATGRVFKLCKPPNDLREVGILVTSENDIYIAGGYRPSNSEVSIDHRAESDFWQYEHAGNRWLPRAPLLRARIGCRLVHCCWKLYALGGRVYEGDGRNALKSVEYYDARDNCWTAVSPMPVAMEFHSAVEYRDRIYVLQGEYFFCYDPRKDYWSHLPPMSVPRSQGLAALHKNCIYYIAGICRNHQRTFTVEVYDIEKNAWCRKRDLPFDHATSPYIKAMLLQGKLHLFVRATQVMVEEHVFRTSRKNSLYQYDDKADLWTKVYETPDRLWDLGRHFECVVAKLYPQCLQKVL
ncbi:kelch repeat and BTB domain-containing protein 8 [Solea senegalensis]|uniref:Kelch repeat and BTB domain-containing protein 8 n=1 Tax=Solea senegalensis TaxID=28829 RepID=A0AAV6QNE4_SOLSE|nr:kelch repeat and BTB domain-containing protein 8 [Solea senegalensis]